MATDSQLLALADALREAVAGKSEPRRIAAARRVVAVLASVPARRGGNRRGPKARHDHEWARARLMALATSADGLPDNQARLIEWLADQFAETGIEVPSESTLKRIVSEFYAWPKVLDEAAIQKYRSSPALQGTFENAEDYLQWRRLEQRLAQKYLHDQELQRQFGTPDRYMASLFEGYAARSLPENEL